MTEKVMLSNIEPFNELFYKSCFYNSLFPILQYFDTRKTPVLANDVLLYTWDEPNLKVPFTIDYEVNLSESELLQQLGITSKELHYQAEFMDDIKAALMQSHPVIVWIDSFYSSIRQDTYHKIHKAHSLLVYGFDDTQEVFHIMEHKHADTLSYEPRRISYEDMKKAYSGYHEYLNSANREAYFEFYKCGTNYPNEMVYDDSSYDLTVFQANHVRFKNLILERLELIHIFADHFAYITSTSNNLQEFGEELLSRINEIINAKLAEKYKLKVVGYPNPAAVQLLDQVMANWRMIRVIIGKFLFSGIYKTADLQLCLNKLQHIYETEQRYYQLLFH
ncbi:hypothetical protein E8L90_06225 [Brevibacillus antibioticus]|uniref:Butirosin biosynthesis protein H N-terminal domain-containing protein n=1 Tax=Brevibacillus antibioticus TaxID=2570228 RepID=A0A4U2Y4V3_9BACL|nr:BtrH N-terminal domain-containing protein [Brevibacillus antibioticus]TKI55085.1 hypothetical protein E8L90_06225 [Brevibacillus antibioticus]